MDRLDIVDLKLSTRIGVYEWEQRINQTLLLDISCPLQLNKEPLTLADTVDYERLSQLVTAFVQGRSFELIEHVATQVATLVLTEFSVAAVKVGVCKPFAVAGAKQVKISVERDSSHMSPAAE